MVYHLTETSRLWRREPIEKMYVGEVLETRMSASRDVNLFVIPRCFSTNPTIRDISHVLSSWILSLGSVGHLCLGGGP